MKTEEAIENNIEVFATKEDVYACKVDIVKLESTISEMRNHIVRWLFCCFIVLTLMILGLYFRK